MFNQNEDEMKNNEDRDGRWKKGNRAKEKK